MKEKNKNITLRPMMKITEMVSYLKTKNIKFELISEKNVEKYLRDNNNYYNITSHKHNFENIWLMVYLLINILI